MRSVNVLSLALLFQWAYAAAPDRGFEVRGALPWHNFLSGPTAWNESDWRNYLDWMKRSGLNLLALHCYTGGAQRYATYVEPMIRIEYRNVLPEAGFDTSLTARWGYRPLAIRNFAFGTGRLFGGADAYGSDAALRATGNEDRYRRAQALIRRVFEMAHARGIQVGIGFEFGVYPPEFFSIVPQDSYLRPAMLPDPTHPASREILRITIDDILKAYPGIDWIWLWLGEHEVPIAGTRLSPALENEVKDSAPLFQGADAGTAFTGAWSLVYIRCAHEYLRRRAPRVRMAVGGWGGARQLNGILAGLDRGLPSDIVLTCLNPAQGLSPQPAVFKQIATHREIWVMPWLEGDGKLWHPQPRVALLREQLQLARKQRARGAVAIHWRTEDIRANFEAFARFAGDPDGADVDKFYAGDTREWLGPSGASLAPLLTRIDREQWFEPLSSPEYYPYDPGWGRLKPEERTRIRDVAAQIEAALPGATDTRHRANLRWLAATFQFTLLLDEVSRAMEPAYRLKETGTGDRAQARASLEKAPIEALFRTYAGRVRSRGELGVLSSLNQKLWLQYLELRGFLDRN